MSNEQRMCNEITFHVMKNMEGMSKKLACFIFKSTLFAYVPGYWSIQYRKLRGISYVRTRHIYPEEIFLDFF